MGVSTLIDPRPRHDDPVRMVPKHHALVRLAHWVNVPLLLGLIATGLAIYWAAPVFVHPRDPVTRSRDYLLDAGAAIAALLHDRGGDPRAWIYDHLSLGTGQLARALRLHWALAYLFMLNGALYLLGLLAGGGWRALLPRRSDPAEALAMVRFYLGVIPMAVRRRPWPHPVVRTKYNALQRAGYLAMPLAGALVVLSGWAMHKPVQLGWLERLFVNYDGARVVHFGCLLVLGSFVVPHVILVIADGWDTFRSMVVGWSARVRESGQTERDREEARPPVGVGGAPTTGPETSAAGDRGPQGPGAAGEASAPEVSPGTIAEDQTPAADAAPATGEKDAPGTPLAATGRPASESAPAAPPVRAQRLGVLAERPEIAVEVPRRVLEARSRRDFLLYAAGILATAVGAWWLLPDATRGRLVGMSRRERLDSLAARVGLTRERRERVLDRALTFDDDVSEALYSKERRVRTYRRSDVTPLRNNYHGRTPGPDVLRGWSLNLSGLASGRIERLSIDQLLRRFAPCEQVTRLVCVEGWSAVAWWGGIRFADLLAAFPPASGARWAAVRSTVSLDRAGRPEPYYVSIDLGTALHPQTLLATHQDGRPLTLAHGAPLRLVAPVKLGLKNIKAITDIAYTAGEPPDYWNERGYSKYDGL